MASYYDFNDNNMGSFRAAFPITPNDNTDITVRPRGLYIGTGGTLIAVGANGVACTFLNVPNGTFIDFGPVRILATGTTAAGIIGLI